ncbi:MAG: HAD family hydrolase [Propioniciclava sp.]
MPAEATLGPAALLWDFDGTLGDSEPLWWRAETRFLAELGVSQSDEEAQSRVGMSLAESVDLLLTFADRRDLDPERCGAQLNAYVMELIQDEGLSYRPGAQELLAVATAAQVPCALVSQTYAAVLEVGISGLPEKSFAVIVSGDRVSCPKPHPEPYLTAAAQLGVRPQDCLVIEDSVSGLRSAAAAGIPALGVPFHGELVPGPQQRILPTLAGVQLDDLSRIWRELTDA